MQNETNQEARIQNLVQSLSEMETALNERYCDIGKSLLEIAEKEDKEINQLVDKIVETRKELAVLQKKIQCPGCLTYNGAGSRFCSNCGMRLL